MLNFNDIISLQIFFPIAIAVLLLVLGAFCSIFGNTYSKYIALFSSIFSLILAFLMLSHFNLSEKGFQFLSNTKTLSTIGGRAIFSYKLGVDGISLGLIVLTSILLPFCILSAWNSYNKPPQFFAMLLMVQGITIGVFSALDLVLFYVFFEASLIPMFILIGVWGGDQGPKAAFKFFLYTFAGSLLFLISIIYIITKSGVSDIPILYHFTREYPFAVQQVLWMGFFIAFALKLPMLPLHSWLPHAHVQAPTAGSMLLAGILLKMGGYGFMRLSVPFFPAASEYYSDFVIILSIIAIIYTSMVALVQSDIKKLIAYSSIAHMGYVTAGIFALNVQGYQGAIFSMISHGIVSAALFFCIGILYDRKKTKEISFYEGIAGVMPKFSFFFVLCSFASIALPGTSGFIGEFLVTFSVLKYRFIYGVLIAIGMVLGATYMLLLCSKIIFGNTNKNCKDMQDLSYSELFTLLTMCSLMVILGIFPNAVIMFTNSSVELLQLLIMNFRMIYGGAL
ncbi:NADH-quinone oxidoreductase subunit M [Candidatus Cyrtobacter comes]|uniref:NADH-quinone oxidoreductase subunit M n=1 Tax=Candidatus Cyrtobacter comes TaxID=675776 RepID=A0ABU5L6X4_9RICK|nr:NADH-quinone oxidoreductase subunit M [Candidatus Cyrtobacter comes]MDZ5761873.1 NADH-quinone oxidoreductase subunit M [Candidatus Cyrtobacter comes]